MPILLDNIARTMLLVGSLLLFTSCGESNTRTAEHALPIIKDGMVGFVSSEGNILFEPKLPIWPELELSTPLYTDLIPYRNGDYMGYIDKEGNVKIEPKYKRVWSFTEDEIALVRKENGELSYITAKGDEINKGQTLTEEGTQKFLAARHFRNGYALVQYPQGFSYINKTGKRISQEYFEDARDFSSGFAAVKSSGKWGFLAENGTVAIKPTFTDVTDFLDGVAGARVEGASLNGFSSWGIIDKNGNLVVSPTNRTAYPIGQGSAVIGTGEVVMEKRLTSNITYGPILYALVSSLDEYLPKAWYTNVCKELTDGMCTVSLNGQMGYADKKGQQVVKTEFNASTPFRRGYGIAANRSTAPEGLKVYLISTDGKTREIGVFDDAWVSNLTKPTVVAKRDGNFIFLDTKGAQKFSMPALSIEATWNNLILAREATGTTYFNAKGDKIASAFDFSKASKEWLTRYPEQQADDPSFLPAWLLSYLPGEFGKAFSKADKGRGINWVSRADSMFENSETGKWETKFYPIFVPYDNPYIAEIQLPTRSSEFRLSFDAYKNGGWTVIEERAVVCDGWASSTCRIVANLPAGINRLSVTKQNISPLGATSVPVNIQMLIP